MCRRDFGSMVSVMGKAFLKGIISSTEGEVSRTAFHSVRLNDCCFTQLPEVLGHCCVKDIFLFPLPVQFHVPICTECIFVLHIHIAH